MCGAFSIASNRLFAVDFYMPIPKSTLTEIAPAKGFVMCWLAINAICLSACSVLSGVYVVTCFPRLANRGRPFGTGAPSIVNLIHCIWLVSFLLLMLLMLVITCEVLKSEMTASVCDID